MSVRLAGIVRAPASRARPLVGVSLRRQAGESTGDRGLGDWRQYSPGPAPSQQAGRRRVFFWEQRQLGPRSRALAQSPGIVQRVTVDEEVRLGPGMAPLSRCAERARPPPSAINRPPASANILPSRYTPYSPNIFGRKPHRRPRIDRGEKSTVLCFDAASAADSTSESGAQVEPNLRSRAASRPQSRCRWCAGRSALRRGC